METVQIVLSSFAIISAVTSIFFAYKAINIVKKAEARRASEPKEKKYLVPNKGIFSRPPKRKKPKYWTDEEIWTKEQDERRTIK